MCNMTDLVHGAFGVPLRHRDTRVHDQPQLFRRCLNNALKKNPLHHIKINNN